MPVNTLKNKYANVKPVGVYPMCNYGELAILQLGDTRAVAAWDFGEGYQAIQHHKIYTTTGGRSYICKGKRRFYFDEMSRCN